MTQEDKELLLKDLSARLPYGVKVLDNSHENYGVSKLINIGVDGSILIDNEINDIQYYPIIDEIKPYLRPMSSMTEEEKEEIKPLFSKFTDESRKTVLVVRQNKMALYQDWLNANHFDYRGLIPMGLAIAVTEENNPYENDI